MAAYATIDEFAEWLRRPTSFSDEEEKWVQDSLELAGIMIRNHVDMTDADAERLFVAKQVSFRMVRAAFGQAWNRYGLRSWTETTGAIVESATVENPHADLIFNAGHLTMFGIKQATAPKYYFGECV